MKSACFLALAQHCGLKVKSGFFEYLRRVSVYRLVGRLFRPLLYSVEVSVNFAKA